MFKEVRGKKETTPHLTVSAKKRRTLKILKHFEGGSQFMDFWFSTLGT
jgi:hypothetical protein